MVKIQHIHFVQNLAQFSKSDPCLGILEAYNRTYVLGFFPPKKRPIRAAHPRMRYYVSNPLPGVQTPLVYLYSSLEKIELEKWHIQ